MQLFANTALDTFDLKEFSIDKEKAMGELRSDIISEFEDLNSINPTFYRKLNFKALPDKYQKYKNTRCMYYCVSKNDFLFGDLFVTPDYF